MSHDDDVKTLAEKINGIRIAMLVTTSDEGLHARPMATQEVTFDGDLWFFTSVDAEKTQEIARHPQVCVAYADPSDQRYVSVSGTARVIDDRARMKALWTPFLNVWFDKGADDPMLRLIRVRVERAEYWDAPSGRLVQLLGFIRKAAGGEAAIGENRQVSL